jgi:hypothetical protein
LSIKHSWYRVGVELKHLQLPPRFYVLAGLYTV